MKQVLYFSASWCGPCRAIKPMITELQSQLAITVIDADADPARCSHWNVRNIPTIMVVKGNQEVGRLVGSTITKNNILNLYNQ
jgi:thioredoxin 1